MGHLDELARLVALGQADRQQHAGEIGKRLGRELEHHDQPETVTKRT